MEVGDRQRLVRRLYDMERTIAALNRRVNQLQLEVDRGRAMASPALLKGGCLRTLFSGWRQNGVAASMARQNRRVERHAASHH